MRLSLNRPVRLFVDGNTEMAHNLRQEFVRIKAKKEGDREAIVTGLQGRDGREGGRERREGRGREEGGREGRGRREGERGRGERGG